MTKNITALCLSFGLCHNVQHDKYILVKLIKSETYLYSVGWVNIAKVNQIYVGSMIV